MRGYLICPTCASWAANRDDSGADEAWLARVSQPGILARIGAFIPEPGEDGEGIHAFSRVYCDGCGDPLAGERVEAHWMDATMRATALGHRLLEAALS